MSDPRVDAYQRLVQAKKDYLAALRASPPQPVRDYTLTSPDGSPVALSALFGGKRDLLLVHNMGRACVYCTLWADGFVGVARHLEDRAGFALCSPDEPAVLRDFAASRLWPFRCVSQRGTSFGKDMGFEPEPGKFWPGVSAFHKGDDGAITRIAYDMFGPGDNYCAVWPLLDLLRDGLAGWEPKYRYA